MITCVLVQASYGFLISENDVIEMLINIPALLFLNDIKNYVGTSFKKHIKMHHSEITSNKIEFMYMDKQDPIYYRAWFRWNQIILYTISITSTLNYIMKGWKCTNFDVWYQK
jgi:hypothetical protein